MSTEDHMSIDDLPHSSLACTVSLRHPATLVPDATRTGIPSGPTLQLSLGVALCRAYPWYFSEALYEAK
jgi:hypothetical protein